MPVTQKDIARQVGLDVSSVNQILHRRPGTSFSARKVREVLQAARELGYDLSRLSHAHHRRHVRKPAMVAVDISVYRADGALFDRGTGVIRNLSVSGAFLIALVLSRRAIPLGPHTVGIRPLGGTPRLPELLGRIIRFDHAGGSIGVAVEFLDGQRENSALLYRSLRPERRSERRARSGS